MTMAKRDLTVSEYLSHMARSMVEANADAMEAIRDLVDSGKLKLDVPIGDQVAHLKGLSLTPQGFFELDELEIECESSVHVAYDDNDEPIGLAMSMKKGLFERDMHVKFRAKFRRRGTIEGLEVLRDASNAALSQELERIDMRESN